MQEPGISKITVGPNTTNSEAQQQLSEVELGVLLDFFLTGYLEPHNLSDKRDLLNAMTDDQLDQVLGNIGKTRRENSVCSEFAKSYLSYLARADEMEEPQAANLKSRPLLMSLIESGDLNRLSNSIDQTTLVEELSGLDKRLHRLLAAASPAIAELMLLGPSQDGVTTRAEDDSAQLREEELKSLLDYTSVRYQEHVQLLNVFQTLTADQQWNVLKCNFANNGTSADFALQMLVAANLDGRLENCENIAQIINNAVSRPRVLADDYFFNAEFLLEYDGLPAYLQLLLKAASSALSQRLFKNNFGPTGARSA